MIEPLVVEPQLGVIWVGRGADQIFIEPHEAEATARAILATADALLDAV